MNAWQVAWLAATPTTTEEGREVNSHTFIGLGLMATVLVIVWLIRRTRA
jgi:hypothetical protein